ncbi:site-specific integrase, partial [Sphingobium chlorophenolicum]
MAAAVKYVKTRNGVYQYVRRVPESVKRQPAHYAHHFGSRPLFRASLKTKDQGQMHIAAMAAHTDFERRLASISGGIMPQAPKLLAASSSPLRTVTQADLNELTARYRRVTAESFERAYVKVDASAEDAAEYERILYNIEVAAEEERKALESRAGGGKASALSEDALWVIGNDRWNAPAGSEAFGAIVGAIRAGTQQGRDDIQALIEGRKTPRLAAQRSIVEPSVPTLSEAVDQYLDHRKLPFRTEAEVRSSLRLFEKLFGNKRLDGLTRRDFHNYAEHLAKQVIGGKTVGSIVRPPSSATVKKRIGLLRSVINHAIDRDCFSGPNPASGIKVDAYVERPNRSVMPEKRRLSVDEMNLLFQHPWFTGCASETNTHVSGGYRLRGQEYWVPVVAALTGCRAGELGGLMLSEVMLEGTTP